MSDLKDHITAQTISLTSAILSGTNFRVACENIYSSSAYFGSRKPSLCSYYSLPGDTTPEDLLAEAESAFMKVLGGKMSIAELARDLVMGAAWMGAHNAK